ncbi:hypothetical protein LTR84_002813 [Exophiala bonariae]|uniref:Nephrocystin 3-like N-terminal domain-containing protein n=1 Tax=Exophiala bonariae TaxID=1690606 RepID=A0AAV9NA15_9EURO|nr:hypothetical protein LTR84_002813 [Exophiala bonariae]
MSIVFDGDFTLSNQLDSAQVYANTVNFGSSQETAEYKRTRLLESLKFKNIDTRWTYIRKEHVHTCAWILEEPEFRDWLAHSNAQENNGFLWITGRPGCGKSTLMKYAFSATRKKMEATTFASFFFNVRGHDLEKSTPGMYRSLLCQLLGRQTDQFISNVLDDVMMDEYQSETFVWTNESLESLFRAVIMQLKRPVTCFIDALDECDEEQIRQMVSSFSQLGQLAWQHQIQFQVCFSSRHYPSISIRRARELILDGRAGHDHDITDYIEGVLDIGTGPLADEVRAEVQEKSGGIFMWVVLVVDLLNVEYNHGQMKALRQRLKDIPEQLSTLFQQILTRHCSNREQVLLCLQWLLFAKEPLRPRQLYCAVVVETDQDIIAAGQQSTDLVVMKKFVLSSSKGLAEIVQSGSSSIVQFIHESVRDFLLKENGLQDLWSEVTVEYAAQSQDRLKKCCVSYLEAFKTNVLGCDFILHPQAVPFLSEARKFEPEAYPFLRYATDNVLYHADRAASNQISQSDFLEQFDRVTWIVLHNTFQPRTSRRYHWDARLLYILAQINAAKLIGHHPMKASYTKLGRERFGTPLFVALAAGNTEVIQYFLELHVEVLPLKHPARIHLSKCIVTGENRSKSRWNVLYKQKNDILAQVLEFCDDMASMIFLQSASIEALHRLKDYRSGYERLSLLARAASAGCYETAKFLLEEVRIDPNMTAYNGTSALHSAAQSGYEKLVRLLLEHDMTDVNLKDKSGWTPLMSALKSIPAKNSETAVKVLREFQAFEAQRRDQSVNTSDAGGFAHVSENSTEAAPECRRVDVNAKNSAGRSALSAAICRAQAPIVVKTLLESYNIEINSQDDEGTTPLSHAAASGQTDIVKILLDTGKADIDSRDQAGRTPLSYAAENGRTDVVKILLNTGKAEINSPDKAGRTPLSYAAENSRTDVVKILLNTGEVDVDSRDDRGRSALSYAAESSGEATLQVPPASWRADVDSRDYIGGSSLSFRVRDRSEERTGPLGKKRKLEVDSKDIIDGSTCCAVEQIDQEAKIEAPLETSSLSAEPFALTTAERHFRVILKYWRPMMDYITQEFEAPLALEDVVVLVAEDDKAAWCTTCKTYVEWRWGPAGSRLLNYITSLLVDTLSLDSTSNERLVQTLPPIKATVTLCSDAKRSALADWAPSIAVQGTWQEMQMIADIFGWLFDALLPSANSLPNYSGALGDKSVIVELGSETIYSLVKSVLEHEAVSDSSCWLALFPTNAISQGPIPERPHNMMGLEIEYPVLVAISGVDFPVMEDGGIYLDGFRSALYPIHKDDKSRSLQWHLETLDYLRNDDCGIEREEEVRLSSKTPPRKWYKTRVLIELTSPKRRFVGWCISALITFGTSRQDPHLLEWSNARNHRRNVIETTTNLNFNLSFHGIGATAGKSIKRGRSQINAFEKHEENLQAALINATKSQVLLFRHSTLQAWLIPKTSFLLQLVQSYMAQLMVDDPTLSLPIHFATASYDGGQSAYQALWDHRNEPIPLGSNSVPCFLFNIVRMFLLALEKLAKSSEGGSVNGWEMKDVIDPPEFFDLKRHDFSWRQLPWFGGWNQLLPEIRLAFFFEGLGDPIVANDDDRCAECTQIPKARNLLGITMLSLKHFTRRSRSKYLEGSGQLTENCYWDCSKLPFRQERRGQEHRCNAIQRIIKTHRCNAPQPEDLSVGQQGAVIFEPCALSYEEIRPRLL